MGLCHEPLKVGLALSVRVCQSRPAPDSLDVLQNAVSVLPQAMKKCCR